MQKPPFKSVPLVGTSLRPRTTRDLSVALQSAAGGKAGEPLGTQGRTLHGLGAALPSLPQQQKRDLVSADRSPDCYVPHRAASWPKDRTRRRPRPPSIHPQGPLLFPEGTKMHRNEGTEGEAETVLPGSLHYRRLRPAHPPERLSADRTPENSGLTSQGSRTQDPCHPP